jgi:acetyl-CoA acetyltransferase
MSERDDPVILGVGMTRFGRWLERPLRDLARAAIAEALADAGLEPGQIEAAYVGNAVAGLMQGQECIRGQVLLQQQGFSGISVVNVENACASGATACHEALGAILAGRYGAVLVLGAEKLYHADKQRSFAALAGAIDVERRDAVLAELGLDPAADGARSVFMDYYAEQARRHMARYGTSAADFAAIAAKSTLHASLNPKAQFTERLEVDEVLAAAPIVAPLTRPMCAPIGDGAAALVLAHPAWARRLGTRRRPVRVTGCALRSGVPRDAADRPDAGRAAIEAAYAQAGVDPRELDLAECHDATAPAELFFYEQAGLCAEGEGGRLAASGATRLGGQVPVNTSGGLLRKGHPVGATGVAQLVELTDQLLERAGARQVPGARLALAHNGGGLLAGDYAASVATVLAR